MKWLAAGFLLTTLLCGCSTTKAITLIPTTPQKYKLSKAVQSLEKGNEDAAIKLLEEVSEGKGIPGVTDEALFRLSMLGIRRQNETDGMKQVLSRLERLRADYPSSSWTRMAWPLMEYIASVEAIKGELRTVKVKNASVARENRDLHAASQQTAREIRELQANNQSLAKENRELNQRIEKLKSLDLELERKIRR
jgi:hypothetical protein